jgi:hypothetical protein
MQSGMFLVVLKFFFLIVFGGIEALIVFILLSPHREQPTVKYHPRWQPSKDYQSAVGWVDCWIRTQDFSFTIWYNYQ